MIPETQPERVFEWPCDRRDAHHAHPVTEPCPDIFDCDLGSPFCVNGEPIKPACPGVRAHPATQIGGSYKKW